MNIATLTSQGVKDVFYGKYFSDDVRSRMRREFMYLKHGDMSLAYFVRKYDRWCHFMPQIADNATEKRRHFIEGLKPTIQRDVLMTDPAEYSDAIIKAFGQSRF
ncbi:hypothetical protein F511_18361 [Dorcoceras hygrometricum]|uniref:Retrotransposon gag domain-containing protein n=1 Tax=Dorcoceras hygrometricum TaxID=472368 RepID=A0A2Z7BXE0_9LAMI|nr:hypothetical protein F511_18361 [Dorcoceras hygrometricum]